MCPERKTSFWPAWAFLIPGAVLLACSEIGFFPITLLAGIASQDGDLTEAFITLLTRSQWTLAWILLAMAPLTFPLRRILPHAERVLFESSRRAFLIAISAGTFLLTLAVQFFVFNGIPHVTDAIAHLFQAKILCLGKLYAAVPACHESFSQYYLNMTTSGRWFAFYPPGHALTLAAFLKPGIVHISGPMMLTLSVTAFICLVGRFYNEKTARMCGVLFALSPLNLLLASSFMPHISFLMHALCGMSLWVHSLNEPRAYKTTGVRFLGGFLLGMAAITRPQDFVLLAATVCVGVSTTWKTQHRALLCSLPGTLVGFAIPLAVYAAWNTSLYGTFFTIGYQQTTVGTLTTWIRPYWGLSGSFTLSDAARQCMWSLLRLNKALFGWPSSLVFIPLALLGRRPDRRNLLCMAAVLIVIGFYFFYFYYGAEFECRFYSSAIPYLIVLTVVGVRSLHSLVLGTGTQDRESNARRIHASRTLVGGLLTAFMLHSMFYYWPFYLWPTYAADYEQATRIVHRLAEKRGLRDAVVLIDTERENAFRYSSGFIYNDPLLDNDVIYARDLPGKNECLRESFPGRSLYRFTPTMNWSNGDFKLLEVDDRQD